MEKRYKAICIEQANRFFDIIRDESYTDLEVKLYYIMALLWDEHIGINKAYELCEECGIFKSSHLEISFRYGENKSC